jgi:hypothetical protein
MMPGIGHGVSCDRSNSFAVLELADVLDEDHVAFLRMPAGARGDLVDVDRARPCHPPRRAAGEQRADDDAEEQHDQRVPRNRLQGNARDFGHCL